MELQVKYLYFEEGLVTGGMRSFRFAKQMFLRIFWLVKHMKTSSNSLVVIWPLINGIIWLVSRPQISGPVCRPLICLNKHSRNTTNEQEDDRSDDDDDQLIALRVNQNNNIQR